MTQGQRLSKAIDYYWKYNIPTFPVQVDYVNGKKKWIDKAGWQGGVKREDAIGRITPERNCLAALTGEKTGLFVLDIDAKGWEEQQEFNIYLERLDINLAGIPHVKTWSGGQHFLFKYPSELNGMRTTRAGTLLKFVDFRGNGGIEFVPPSQINGQDYVWISRLNGSLPSMPPNLLNEILKFYAKETVRRDKEKEEVKSSGDYANVESAVKFLKDHPLGYDEWYRCGLALAEMGEGGFGHWITLSTNEKNNDSEAYLHYKFDNFLKTREEITIGTLFEIAKKYGYKIPGSITLTHAVDKEEVVDSVASAFFKPDRLKDAIIYQATLSDEEKFSLFEETDHLIQIIKGQVTVVTGYPYSGKSNVVDDIMVRMNKKYDWHWSVFSPESQPINEHVDSLISKHYRKPVRPGTTEPLSPDQYDEAVDWIKDNIFIMDAATVNRSIDNIMSITSELQNQTRVDALVIDPYNELEHKRPSRMSETEYIAFFLGKLRAYALRENIHIFIVAHPTKVFPEKGTKPPIVTPYNIAGSANWFNKADNIISVYRDLRPSQPTDKTTLYIQKVKRRRLGMIGNIDLRYEMATGHYEPYGPKPDLEESEFPF